MDMREAFLTILGHTYAGMPQDDVYRAMYEAGRVFGLKQGKRETVEYVNDWIEDFKENINAEE